MTDLLLVDGPYLAHRSYDAPYHLLTSDGRNSTMLHSFIRSLNYLRKQINPKKTIIAWESPGTMSWRKNLDCRYKSTRGTKSDFIEELKDLQKILFLLNIPQYKSPNNEADDVIANFATKAKYPVVIFTSDKDLMQLVNGNCQVFDGKSFYDAKKVEEKFFVTPDLIPDLLAIAGDKSDNIEGINGFGFKKSAKVIHEFGHVENIGPTCSSMLDWSIFTKEKILMNKKLTLLNPNCYLEKIPTEEVKESLFELLNKYELKSIKEKLNEYKLIGENR